MSAVIDRVAADEAERERQHREGLAIEARSVSVEELAARSLREITPSDLLDLIANTPACEGAADALLYAVVNLGEASWVVIARRLRDAIVAEQVRRETADLKRFRSSAWEHLA